MSTLDYREVHQEATIVDLHVHPSMQQELFLRNLGVRYTIKRSILRGNPFTVRASFPRLHDGGYDVILSTLYVPEKPMRQDFPILNLVSYLRPATWHKLITAPNFEATLRIMDDMEKAVEQSGSRNPMKMACSVADLDAILSRPKIRRERPIAVIHSVEGAHSLGGKEAGEEGILSHLETLFDRGVVYITLAHFYTNQVVHPCYPFPDDVARLSSNDNLWRDVSQGLTELGKKVVRRMIEMGMLIDLSHSTPVARKQIYDLIDESGKRVPLLATHVGAYGINPSPYNLTDWEIKRIARDGGVIGVIFMPYWLMPKESNQGINAISQHIQYLIDTGGEDVVGIGTDFDGFTTPPDDLDNASRMERLTQRLLADGHSVERIKKIWGGNALRALREGWGKKV